jgi:hypothetical protein
MVPKVGFSQKSRRQWAGWMCKDRNPDCTPEWISEQEIYAFWLESVSGTGENRDDTPPF